MGFLDRLFGREEAETSRAPQNAASARASSYRDVDGQYAPPPPSGSDAPIAAGSDEDRQAIERYRYLLRTAPPETIEQVHAEAFTKLTEPQRQQVLADLSATLPPSERPAGDDPQSLARAATRAEYTQPGFMERTFAGRSFGGGGGGLGATLGASMLGTIGGYVIGSALVSAFMAPTFAGEGTDGGGDGETGQGDAGAEQSDAGADAGGDAGGGDWGAADAGGFGDFGGDFGGGFDGF